MSSYLTILFGTLGVYALMILCLVFLMTRGHQRMDEVVTGLVNEVPIPKKYRWILIFHDFWAYVLVGTMLLLSFAAGFYGAADFAESSKVKAVATFCAVTCLFMFVGFFILCVLLTHYMASVVRESDRQ